MSLRGWTILLTRDPEESSEFITAAGRGGARVIAIPTIAIRDPRSWEACDRAIADAGRWTAIAFTSAHGVRKFFGRVIVRGSSPGAFRSKRIYAVGGKTARELSWHGLRADVVPAGYSAADLASVLRGEDLDGQRVLLPQGNLARSVLPDALKARGAEVETVEVYRTVPAGAEQARHLRALLDQGAIDVIAFASPSAVENLAKLLEVRPGPLPPMPRIAAIGGTTAEAVSAQGWTCSAVAGLSTMEGLLGAIESLTMAGK